MGIMYGDLGKNKIKISAFYITQLSRKETVRKSRRYCCVGHKEEGSLEVARGGEPYHYHRHHGRSFRRLLWAATHVTCAAVCMYFYYHLHLSCTTLTTAMTHTRTNEGIVYDHHRLFRNHFF